MSFIPGPPPKGPLGPKPPPLCGGAHSPWILLLPLLTTLAWALAAGVSLW